MRRSRYYPRYGELDQPTEPVPAPPPIRLDEESYGISIAGRGFGKVRIFCEPKSENFAGGRRWGKIGTSDVAIVPFSMKAQILARDAMLRSYELKTFDVELFLSDVGPSGSGPESFPESCPRPRCPTHSSTYIMDHPAPAEVVQNATALELSRARSGKPWKLRSELIQDCDGFSRAARWTWDAHGHDPKLLHGAVALRHHCHPFLIACRTQGKLYMSLIRRIRIPLKFGNVESQPVWWTLSPQTSNATLSDGIQELDADMQRMNRGGPTIITREQGEPVLLPQGGNYYRQVNFGEGAQAILGNLVRQDDSDRLFRPRTHAHSVQENPSELPQRTEPPEEHTENAAELTE